MTVAQFLECWLKDYAWANLAPRTAEGYEYIIRRHVIPELGNTILTQLKPDHIQRYYSKKLNSGRYDGSGGLSSCSVRHHHMVLHRAFESAMNWGFLGRNPADAVSPPRRQKSEMRTWNEDDIQRFLNIARDKPYYALFYLALFTGMRRSELLALRWCDVDFVLSQVSVTRTVHHVKNRGLIFRQPKTEKGRRTIALSPSATLMLKEHRNEQVAGRILLGEPLADDDLVFSQLDGKLLLPNTITHAWLN